MENNNAGDLIKRERTKKKYTLKKMSELIGFSDAYISMVENGKKSNPSLEFILNISKELDIPSGTLLLMFGFIDDPFSDESMELQKTLSVKNNENDIRYMLKVNENVYYNDKKITSEERNDLLTVMDIIMKRY